VFLILGLDPSQFWSSERRFVARPVAVPPINTTKRLIAAPNEAAIDSGSFLTVDCCVFDPWPRSIAILELGAPFCRPSGRRAANLHDKTPNRCTKRGSKRLLPGSI
jgi:hypothetical protein